MSARFVVDSHNELQELREVPQQPAGIRIGAKIISVVFHPVFVPVYVVAFLVYVHPIFFAGFTKWNRSIVLLQAFVMFAFFPIITVLLLKALKFISKVTLNTQRDRIIPLAASGIWYFWIFWVWYNLPDYPAVSVAFAFAVFLGSSFAWLLNIFIKVSLHAIAMGVLASLMIYLGLVNSLVSGAYIALAIFIAGIVCTARLVISDHTGKELYLGILAGVLAQLIAVLFFA